MFRVTRPYLIILMKPRFFSVFWGENIILCILKGILPFKMHKKNFFFTFQNAWNYIFSRKKIVSTLPKIFRPDTWNTLFLFGLTNEPSAQVNWNVTANIWCITSLTMKVSKEAKIRYRYNQVPHLGHHTGKWQTHNKESQEVSPFSFMKK